MVILGRRLSLEEKFAVAAKAKMGRNRRECGGSANEVDIAIGMEPGGDGDIQRVYGSGRCKRRSWTSSRHCSSYILIRMLQTKVDALDGLESGVLPITPLTKTFSVVTASSKKITVTCQQLPITPAYAFTDYRSQVQTIDHCIVDLATPLSGQLTPFNTYVALSQSRGRNGIHVAKTLA
ncbi:hypothetical protein SCLCIDRAFT_1216491 [Scleroderma citrinum Foug A]|uniref:Uncharacterized protein n=1 Tax=Scleroderma citrinum Foug A TaxID=1036808 RepID=A0A0C3DX83_9AGAM|nr:hypothetical protein SCLCIDRAFT_1216491 [Scleroderma citrinum Foug A]